MAFQIFNQTTQPLELTGGATLTVNGSETLRELGERERAYDAAGHIFVREIEGKPKAAKPSSQPVTAPESGKPSGK